MQNLFPKTTNPRNSILCRKLEVVERRAYRKNLAHSVGNFSRNLSTYTFSATYSKLKFSTLSQFFKLIEIQAIGDFESDLSDHNQATQKNPEILMNSFRTVHNYN